MSAAPTAAGPTVRQKAGGEDEEPGVRIGVAGLLGGERRGVGRQDPVSGRVIRCQPARMWLVQRSRCQRQSPSLLAPHVANRTVCPRPLHSLAVDDPRPPLPAAF